MELCQICGGTKEIPGKIPCGFCNGKGFVLAPDKENPWFNYIELTSFNIKIHPNYYNPDSTSSNLSKKENLIILPLSV